MNTMLLRHIKRIQLSVLTIESSIDNINVSIQAYNTATQLVGVNSSIKSIPTRAQILSRFSNIKDPKELDIVKREITTQLNVLIRKIQNTAAILEPAEKKLDDIIVYIEIGRKYITLFRTLASLLNILIKGLRLALVPLTSLLANEAVGEKVGNIILKIEAYVSKVFNTIDTWIRWVENFVDNTLKIILESIQKIYSFVASIVNRIRSIIAFINSLSIELLKALLGISPREKIQVLSEYADIIDNTPELEDEDEDKPTNNGDTEDIEEIITTNDGGGELPSDYYENISLSQITRLKFILEKQRTKNRQKTGEFLQTIPTTEILNQLYNIRQQIKNGIISLSQEDIEYISLLKEYGILIDLEPRLEKTYSLDKQISSLEEAEAELRRREIQRLTNENIRIDGEYEEYGKNRNNANITYRRKNL